MSTLCHCLNVRSRPTALKAHWQRRPKSVKRTALYPPKTQKAEDLYYTLQIHDILEDIFRKFENFSFCVVKLRETF